MSKTLPESIEINTCIIERLNTMMLHYQTGIYVPEKYFDTEKSLNTKTMIYDEEIHQFVENTKNRTQVSSLIEFAWNIQQLGFYLSDEDISKLMTLKNAEIIYQHIYSAVKKFIGADRSYNFFYSSETFADSIEAIGDDPYFYAFLHYIGLIPSARIPEFPKTEINVPPLAEMEKEIVYGSKAKLTRLPIFHSIEFINIFENLISTDTPLSPSMEEDVAFCMKYFYSSYFSGRSKDLRIPCKTTLAFVFTVILQEHLPYHCLLKNINNATDVLRIYAVYSGCPADLADTKNLKFKNHLNGFERTLFLNLLNLCPNLEGDIARYPEVWKRAFERIKPQRFSEKKYGRILKVHRGLCNKDYGYPRSLNAKVGNLIRHSGDSLESFKMGFKFLSQYPGIFLRNFDTYVRKYGNRLDDDREENLHFITLVCTTLQEVCRKAPSSKMILTLLNYYMYRTDKLYWADVEPRYVLPKNSMKYIAVSQVSENLCHPNYLDTMYISIYRILYMELLGRFKNLPYLGRVYFDPVVENCVLPTKVRSQNDMAKFLGRGSRFNFTKKHEDADYEDVFVPFIHWTNGKDGKRVDIDLSVVFVNETFNKIESCFYQNLFVKDDEGTVIASHSGDFVDGGPYGEEGVAERVYIRRERAYAHGYRYALIQVHSYTMQAFSDVESTYFGIQYVWDTVNDSKFEKIINQRDTTCYGFHSSQCISIPMDPKQTVLTANLQSYNLSLTVAVLDLMTGDLIWADTGIDTSVWENQTNPNRFVEMYKHAFSNKEAHSKFQDSIRRTGNNVDYTIVQSMNQLYGILNAPNITMSSLLKLHVDARGAQVMNPENADVIFTLPGTEAANEAREDQNVLTPFMVERWLSEFLPTLE